MQEDQDRPPATPEPAVPGTARTEPAVPSPSDALPAGPALPSAADLPEDPWIGRVIDDRYRIESKLGEGGMGAVFVARHLSLHKPVALKVIREALAGNGELAIRFAREAMATAQFEHPHVASAIDYGGLPEGGAYFVMQLVRGRSLRARMRLGPIPWRKACHILAQVADALSAARASGIVHRDLKPENVLVETREDGSELARVLDFGIAHVSPGARPAPEGAMPNRELTRVGTVIGTPGYMAPEQAVGDRVDHRADLYALGVLLWECIAGRPLWEGADITSMITQQITEEPPALRDPVAGDPIPDELDALIRELLARHPDARPEHAGEVRDRLRSLAERPVVAPGSALGASVGRISEQASGWLSGARNQVDALPSSRRAWVLGATALALVGLSLLLFQDNADDAGPPEAAASALPAPATAAGAAAAAPQPTADEADPTATEAADGIEAQAAPDAVVQRVVEAAKKVVQEASAAIVAPGVPDALAEDAEHLQDRSRLKERRAAARRILDYAPRASIAPYLVALAELELSRTCKDRQAALQVIQTLGDPRALPAIERWLRAPRTGCGFLRLQDCYVCIRRPLRETAAQLQAADGPTGNPD